MTWNAVVNLMNSDVAMIVPSLLFLGFLLVRYIFIDSDGDGLSNDIKEYAFLGRAAAITLLLIMMLAAIIKVCA